MDPNHIKLSPVPPCHWIAGGGYEIDDGRRTAKGAGGRSPSEIPVWHKLFEIEDTELPEAKQQMAEAGLDGTFLGSLKSLFGLFDARFLFLRVSTAFGVAYRQGESGH
jgi:hypothetical protein